MQKKGIKSGALSSNWRVAVTLVMSWLAGVGGGVQAQTTEQDAFMVRALYDQVLLESRAYDWLTYLTKKIGPRLSGSAQASAAVEYTRQMLDSIGLDSVWLQECVVPRWIRGERPERAVAFGHPRFGTVEMRTEALGFSSATPAGGLEAEVMEVQSLDELDERASEARGKIVFFNRPMDAREVNVFRAYGGAVDQRGSGPAKASEYGAVGALVRSMTTEIDEVPHSGATNFPEGVQPIPSLAISTRDAEQLKRMLEHGVTRVWIEADCQLMEPVVSHNVIAEIRGSEYPDEIILVGGHLDSWDLGEGAHDDGAGCVQSMAVLHSFKQMGYRPKRTLRCVLFMNEENGLSGGKTYALRAAEEGLKHIAAIESDAGGFTPRGFGCSAREDIFTEKFKKLKSYWDLLEPYDLFLRPGGGGADISPLRSQGVLLIGLSPDSQRYFDFHHTDRDRLEAVHPRELKMGAAAMTALVYLLDTHGL